MKFIKYNIGKGARSNTSSSTVATVDLSGVYSRLNENNATIGDLNGQVADLNNLVSGLDNKYLRKDKTDSTDYTLTMGKARSNTFLSNKYDSTGIGFTLTETVGTNPNYTLILSGLGNGSTQINSKNVQLSEQVMHYDTVQNQEIMLDCNRYIAISNTTQGAYALIDAGYTCGSNYTILDEALYLTISQDISPLLAAPPVNVDYGLSLEKQGDYWILPLMSDGRNTSYHLKYVVKYNYTAPSGDSVVGQAINLYIKGTNTTTTDYFGGIANKLVATPDYLQLTTNGAGIRITSQGIYRMDAQGNLTQLL